MGQESDSLGGVVALTKEDEAAELICRFIFLRARSAVLCAKQQILSAIVRLWLGVYEHLEKLRRGLFETNFQLCGHVMHA